MPLVVAGVPDEMLPIKSLIFGVNALWNASMSAFFCCSVQGPVTTEHYGREADFSVFWSYS